MYEGMKVWKYGTGKHEALYHPTASGTRIRQKDDI